MSSKIKIEGIEYNHDQVPEALREKYKDDLAEIDRLQSMFGFPPPSSAPLPKAFGYLLITSLLLVVGLSAVSFFSDVNTTIDIQGRWQLIYGIILVGLIGINSVPFITKKAAVPGNGGFFKKILTVISCIVGLSVLCSFSVFSGLPTVLHHLSSKEGELKVTVSGKSDAFNKRTCRPRLIIKEFTWFSSNFICPGADTYNEISVGSEIILKGNVSSFGVEAKQVLFKKDS